VPVSKDTLYEYLDHLEDAFLIRTISMHSTSERQRMVNPRKAYPIDPGLIPIYERFGREHRGRALETVILLELERRGYTVDWLRVGQDREVDFYAERTGEQGLLINVCLDTADAETWEREVGSLERAAAAHPEARALLITLDSSLPAYPVPASIEWQSAAHWLLETG
jgi:predicted AAA+ superfamily ATPase